MAPSQQAVELNLIRSWVLEAGRIALSRSANRSVNIKADFTPVTQIDRDIEDFLLEKITQNYPAHGVLAEEGSSRSGSDFLWIIDPIDGTRAYASGLPVWGVSVGVFHREEPFAGVFHMPVTGDTYWGTRDEAYHNENRLVPRASVDLHSPLAFIAVPSSVHRHFEISFHRIRSLGSVTAHLAYVAYGSATAAVFHRVRIWDMAAILPALRTSQTELVYLSGKAFHPGDLLNGEQLAEPLVAAHSSIIEEVRGFIKLKPGENNLTSD